MYEADFTFLKTNEPSEFERTDKVSLSEVSLIVMAAIPRFAVSLTAPTTSRKGKAAGRFTLVGFGLLGSFWALKALENKKAKTNKYNFINTNLTNFTRYLIDELKS
jgi:hypothetical protein